MKREKKSQAVCWLEQTNPLRGMSIRDLQAVFDTARMGDTQRLHWIFQEIEALNPALLTCVERRASAVANFNWSVSERASQDGALSAEQRDALTTFLSGVTNFSDMLEHLDLAFFRGFAHAQPVWEDDGSVKEVQLLDSWKFLRKGSEWFYNPACNGFTADCTPCADARLLTVVRRRPIDYPALGLHVRHAVGSRDWGRFLERYALPKPAVFMHPGATEDQKADYLDGAVAVENGQVSVWPAGASLTDFAGGSRGTDPFRSFIEHQEKQIILLATGGTLMSLAEAGTGTLAGNAQSDVWDSIVRRDSGVLAASITRDLVKPFLAHAFPGRPVTVDFVFDFDVKPTPKEVLELNALAKQGGYTISQDELEDAIGFTLVKDEAAPQPGGFGAPFMNKAPAPSSARPLADEKPIHHNPAGHTEAAGQRSPGQEFGETGVNVLSAFAQDTGPAADAIRALLENPTPEAAESLLKELPSLLPEDPALAAVIADAMAAEFASKPSASADAVANKEGVCRAKDPAHCPSHGTPREHKDKGFQDQYGNGNPEILVENQAMNAERGKAVISHIIGKKAGYEPHAMYRKDLGWIGVDYGDPGNTQNNFNGGHGISHIIGKHKGAIESTVDAILTGTAYKHDKSRRKVYIIKGRTAVVLSKDRQGRLLITDFEKISDKQLADYTSKGKYHAKGENE